MSQNLCLFHVLIPHQDALGAASFQSNPGKRREGPWGEESHGDTVVSGWAVAG